VACAVAPGPLKSTANADSALCKPQPAVSYALTNIEPSANPERFITSRGNHETLPAKMPVGFATLGKYGK
jgi:hypothetical protein